MQMRCVDAAREAARLAAREDVSAVDSAAALVPAGASVEVRRVGGYVSARVSVRSSVLPGIVIGGEAVAAAEPHR